MNDRRDPRRALAGLAATLCLLALGAGRAVAAVPPDLSYVNIGSPEWTTFKNWVDGALAGPPYPYAFSPTDAMYAYRVTGNPIYAQEAISMVDAMVLDAENVIADNDPDYDPCYPPVARDSYLEIGDIVRDIVLTLDWTDANSTLINTHPGMSNRRTRWRSYVSQAVWNIWHHQTASWPGYSCPWSGWSVDNPGNNYHYSFLEATMYWALGGPDPSLVTFLETQKLPAVKSYFATLPGGGSREGTGYGTAFMRLFYDYRLWSDARPSWSWGPSLDHAAGTIDYWIHATVPTRDRFAPIGDQARESYPWLYDYQRRLVLEARKDVAALHPNVAARASWWLDHISVDAMGSSFNYRHGLLPAGSSELPPFALWYHATGVGAAFVRSSWATDALWMSVVAGPYDESHAHQEQGAFNLFHGNEFVAVTENVWSHSGIEQESKFHNVVRFVHNGQDVVQRNATSTMAVTPQAHGVRFEANLTPAFFPANDGVNTWNRRIDFVNQGKVTVHDTFTIDAGTTQAVWQLNVPVQPQITGNEAVAGPLHVKVLLPVGATLSRFDWTSLNAPPPAPPDYYSGWKLEVRGSSTEYLVEITIDGVDPLREDGFETGDFTGWSALRSGS